MCSLIFGTLREVEGVMNEAFVNSGLWAILIMPKVNTLSENTQSTPMNIRFSTDQPGGESVIRRDLIQQNIRGPPGCDRESSHRNIDLYSQCYIATRPDRLSSFDDQVN